eukprot:g17751.t1
MPYKKANGDSVQYNSKVLEFSLLKESGGLIEVAEIANAAEPIYFRFHDSAPVEGDQCTFFDLATNQWSSEGVSLVDGSQIPEIGTPGTWCSSTHTSIFAVVQIIPFDLTHDPEAGSLNANSYVAATAIVSIFICCVMCPVGCDSKGRVHVVNFKRSEVVEETKTIHEDEDDQVDSKKKVLVRWDVDPDRFMRRLNQLRGHRWVTMASWSWFGLVGGLAVHHQAHHEASLRPLARRGPYTHEPGEPGISARWGAGSAHTTLADLRPHGDELG